MPDWLITLSAVIITAIVAPIVVKRFAPQWQRRQVEVETEGEVAETVATLSIAWKELLAATQDKLEVAEAGLALRDEEIRNKDEDIADLKEQLAAVYEQKMALMGQNLALTAKLAVARDVDVLNNEAEGT
jgi:hypothetical protein